MTQGSFSQAGSRKSKTYFRFYQGKNKLTQIAMGKAADNEYKEGLHKVAEQLVGEVRTYHEIHSLIFNLGWTLVYKQSVIRS